LKSKTGRSKSKPSGQSAQAGDSSPAPASSGSPNASEHFDAEPSDASYRICTVFGAPAGTIVPLEDSLTSRGTQIVRPGSKIIWQADSQTSAEPISLGSLDAIRGERALAQYVLPLLTRPRRAHVGLDGIGSSHAKQGASARSRGTHSHIWTGFSKGRNGHPHLSKDNSGEEDRAGPRFGLVVESLMATYSLNKEATSMQSQAVQGHFDAYSSLSALLPGSPIDHGLLQFQPGWSCITADRVRMLCYRSLSHGLDWREAGKVQGQLLRNVIECALGAT